MGLHFGRIAYLTRGGYHPTSRSVRLGDYADGTWIVWSFLGSTVIRSGAFLSECEARHWAFDHGFTWVDFQNHPGVTQQNFADHAPGAGPCGAPSRPGSASSPRIVGAPAPCFIDKMSANPNAKDHEELNRSNPNADRMASASLRFRAAG